MLMSAWHTSFCSLDGVMSELWSLVKTILIIMAILGLFSSSMVAKIKTGGVHTSGQSVCIV